MSIATPIANPICFLLPSFDTCFLFWFCLEIFYKFVSLWFHRRHQKEDFFVFFLLLKDMEPRRPIVSREMSRCQTRWPTSSIMSLPPVPQTPQTSHVSTMPPLVLEIESFISRELTLLEREKRGSFNQFDRIHIFGEAFNNLSSHFSLYATIFSRIKREYDKAIELGKSAVHEAERLRADSASVRSFFSYAADAERQKFEAKFREFEFHRKTLEEEDALLRKRNADFTAELTKMQQLTTQQKIELEDAGNRTKLLSDTLTSETLRQALLVQQVKRLKADNEKLQHLCNSLEMQMKNDVVLQDQTSVSRKDKEQRKQSGNKFSTLVKAIGAVTAAERKFSVHLVGTHEGGQENVEEELMEAQEKIKKLQRIVYDQNKEIATMTTKVTALSQMKLERPQTPRPSWSKAVDVFPQLVLSSDMTSEAVFEALLECASQTMSVEQQKIDTAAMSKTIHEWFAEEQLCEGDLVAKSFKSFIGRGTGPHVPVYLRWHGPIRNKRMKKGDVEQLLKKFWSERKARMRVEGTLELTSIGEFFLEWLIAQTGSQSSAIELAYNMLEVCEQSQYDPDCGMFLSILQGRVSEATFFDQISTVERLEYIIESTDKKNCGLIQKDVLHSILRKFFPAKSLDDMLKLRFALLRFVHPQSQLVNYKALFSEDTQGNQTRFVELIREQHLREMSEYVVDVEEAIRSVISSDGRIGIGPAKTAIKLLDPAVPNEELLAVVAFGAKVTVEQLEELGENYFVPAELFLSRIRSGVLLRRHTPKAHSDSENESDIDATNISEELAPRDDCVLEEAVQTVELQRDTLSIEDAISVGSTSNEIK